MVSNIKPWEDLIKNLTEEEVITVLTTLGSAKPNRDKDNNLVFQSVCHGSQSWKLCYYIKTKNFFIPIFRPPVAHAHKIIYHYRAG